MATPPYLLHHSSIAFAPRMIARKPDGRAIRLVTAALSSGDPLAGGDQLLSGPAFAFIVVLSLGAFMF